MRPYTLVFLLVVSLVMSGCGTASPDSIGSAPGVQISETGVDNPEIVTEIIRMNNCGGKGDVRQGAQRSLSVSLEGEASLGVDIKVVRADVIARYAESKGVSKAIELVAPPGTDMQFTVAWTEQQWLGTVTSALGSTEAKYRARVPIAVELVSSQDLGCPGGAAKQPAQPVAPQDATGGAPPAPIEPTPEPPTPAPPTPKPPTPTPTLPSLLQNGETLEHNEWALTISNFTYQTLRDVRFSLTNNTGRLVLVPGTFNARVLADTGSLEAVICFHSQPRDQFPQREIEIAAGATIEWTVDFSDMNTWSECYGPVFYPETRSLILVVDDLAGIFKEVRWQTDLPRP